LKRENHVEKKASENLVEGRGGRAWRQAGIRFVFTPPGGGRTREVVKKIHKKKNPAPRG